MITKQKASYNIVKIGLMLFFVSFLGTAFLYFITARKSHKEINNREVIPTTMPETMLYRNRQFGYTVTYSSDLSPKIIDNQGGFLQFVVFEGKANSNDFGFAIGVSALPYEEEIARIKGNFSTDENATLVEEKNDIFKGLYQGKKLYYKPKNNENELRLEDKVVAVFKKDKYTYSISARPAEIDEILKGFSLILISITP